MKRPYVICHMVMSLDGRVTGEFLSRKECEKTTDIYYELNREMKCGGFICGRITMEGSFTGGYYPDLSDFLPVTDEQDYIPDNKPGFYAIAFDPKGKLGWKSALIEDEDEGYGNSQIIEVVTKEVNRKYLSYLKSLDIPYIFAGEAEIDVKAALEKLCSLFGIECILLEGGSVINGHFQRAGVIDELSLVIAPVVAGKDSKPLFSDAEIERFDFCNSKIFEDGTVWLNYKKH